LPHVSDWPGEDRRRPPLGSPTWPVRAPLAAWIREEAACAPAGVRVLDVGCGVKPYFPFFAETASEYVGVDVVENPHADVQGAVESLPLDDGGFDVVLCLQVLEHADDPAQAVRELRRVTAPGGRVLASTHGVQVYHPAPNDLWRWTHAGLERLFRENGDWSSVTVRPGGGSAACIGMLVSIYVDLIARRARVGVLSRALVALVNQAAGALDRRIPVLREPRPGTIFANYHVVAEVPR
jgi:SAM-dependent methyltransferase